MFKRLSILLIILMTFSSHPIFAQDSKTPYTDWMLENYPVTHTNVENMITRVYGNDNPDKFSFLVEFQAKSLYNIFDLMKKEEANWEVFSVALNQWSQSKVENRGENWWEWPDTNWKKVESEYLFLLDTQE
jgi:hypothetical protein